MGIMANSLKKNRDMTQEDKELLLKDLCARLPYKMVVTDGVEDYVLTTPFLYRYIEMGCRPYLRPMSSMTEEERRYCYEHAILFSCDINHNIYFDGFGNISADETIDGFDWLNAHHFDYRRLIEKGLAIEVTEENNPYK